MYPITFLYIGINKLVLYINLPLLSLIFITDSLSSLSLIELISV